MQQGKRHHMALIPSNSRSTASSCLNLDKSVLQLARNTYICSECNNLANSNSPRPFLHLINNISKNLLMLTRTVLWFRRNSSLCTQELEFIVSVPPRQTQSSLPSPISSCWKFLLSYSLDRRRITAPSPATISPLF